MGLDSGALPLMSGMDHSSVASWVFPSPRVGINILLILSLMVRIGLEVQVQIPEICFPMRLNLCLFAFLEKDPFL